MKKLSIAVVIALVLSGCANQEPRRQDVNEESALKAKLPYPVLDWRVLTVVADREKRTMSTLFANNAAADAARNNLTYPAGAVVALVTWHQLDNPNWFGSRVPGAPQQIEIVEYSSGGPKYRSFEEPAFQEQNKNADRVPYITSLKAVPLP